MADSEYLEGSVKLLHFSSALLHPNLFTPISDLFTPPLFFFSFSSHSCIEPDKCGARRARQFQETEHGLPFLMQSRGANLIGYDSPDLATISTTGKTATRPVIGALGFKRALQISSSPSSTGLELEGSPFLNSENSTIVQFTTLHHATLQRLTRERFFFIISAHRQHRPALQVFCCLFLSGTRRPSQAFHLHILEEIAYEKPITS